ncbi:hypothetical protein [uncultured Shewanella sp.]|nr:hypothetical protein [uncultured Shewanella sp.]
MRASRISISGGKISPRTFTFPEGFDGYIIDSANKVSDTYNQIPKEQLAKIDKYVIDNSEKVTESKLFEAIVHDYQRFGQKSFRK